MLGQIPEQSEFPTFTAKPSLRNIHTNGKKKQQNL